MHREGSRLEATWPATHSAAATGALATWVGFVVTQSPVCAITSFWNTPELGLHPQQRQHDKVRLQSRSEMLPC